QCFEFVLVHLLTHEGILLKKLLIRGRLHNWIYRLEFLDAICSDTVWSKTKETFATKGLDMTFDLIKTVAGSVATSLLF
ncbi:hypothetical protein U1495_20675, partial [Aeromonas caviae]